MSGVPPVLTGDPTIPREIRRSQQDPTKVPERVRRRWAGESEPSMWGVEKRDLRIEAHALRELGPATYHVGRFIDEAYERLSERERTERDVWGPVTKDKAIRGMGLDESQADKWIAYMDARAAGHGRYADQVARQEPGVFEKVVGVLTPIAEIAETAIDRGLMPIVEQVGRWGLRPEQLWSDDPIYTAEYWNSRPPGDLTLAGQVALLGEAMGVGGAQEILEDYKARKEAFYESTGTAGRIAGGVGKVLGEVASFTHPWLPATAIMQGTARVAAPMMYGSGRLMQQVPITARTMEMMEAGTRHVLGAKYAERLGKLLERGIPQGAGFGVMSGIRDYYSINPETGQVELQEGWDRISHGLVEAGLWQFYEAAMMAGAAATKHVIEKGVPIATSIPGMPLSMKTKYSSFEALGEWASKNGLRPQKGETSAAYLRRAAEFHAAQGLPLGKPPPTVSRQIMAQAIGAGVEALGFSALDTEFLANGAEAVLEGDWDKALAAVEKYLTTWPALLILKAGSINRIPDYQRSEPPAEVRRTVQETLQLVPSGGAKADLPERVPLQEVDLPPVERLYVAGWRGSKSGDRIRWHLEGDPSRSFEVDRLRPPAREGEVVEPGSEVLGVRVNTALAQAVGLKRGLHTGDEALNALERIWLSSVTNHVRARSELPGHEVATNAVHYLKPSGKAGPPWMVARRWGDTVVRKDVTGEGPWEPLPSLEARAPDPDVPPQSRQHAEELRTALPWIEAKAGEGMADAFEAVAGLLETRSPERDPAVANLVEVMRQRGPERPTSILASMLERAELLDGTRVYERPEDSATYKTLRGLLEVASGVRNPDMAMTGIMADLGVAPITKEASREQVDQNPAHHEREGGRELPGEAQPGEVEGQPSPVEHGEGREAPRETGQGEGPAPLASPPKAGGKKSASRTETTSDAEAVRRADLESGESGAVAVDILTLPITGPASVAKTAFEYWSRGLVDRVGDLGGREAAAVQQRARRTIDRSAQLKGELHKELSEFQKLTSRNPATALGRQGLAATRRLGEVRWDGASGFTLYHDTLEGRGRQLDQTEQAIIDSAKRLRLAMGQQAERAGVLTTDNQGQRVPFVTPKKPRFLRAYSQELHDLTIGSDLYNTLAAEIARLNGISKAVAEGFLSEQINQGWIRLDYSEVRREIPVMPDMLRLPNGKVVRIMEADPFHHMQRAVELGTRRIAFIEQFGQDVQYPNPVTGTQAAPTKDVLTRLVRKHGQAGLTLGRDLFRALHALPTTPPLFLKPGTQAYDAYRVLRFADSMWRSSKLTLAAIPNLFEFLGAPTAYVGARRAARAYSRLATNLFKPVDNRTLTERVEFAESLGAIEIAPAVYSMREGKGLEDAARAVANVFLSPVKGVQFVNEMLAVEGAYLMARDLKRGQGTERDAARLRLLGFTPSQVQTFIAGNGTPQMAGDLLRRIVGSAMGGQSQAPAERSRFALNRWISDHFAFQNYFQARANQWNTLLREVMKNPKGMPSVGAELLGFSALSGALAIATKALALGGVVALLDEAREAGAELSEDPITGVLSLATRAAASNMVGGLGGTVWDAIFSKEDPLRAIARSMTTWQALGTIYQAISGTGRYLDRGLTEDPLATVVQLARELPLARALENGIFGLSIVAIGDSDPELDRALAGLKRWRRENASLPFGSAGDPQDQHIAEFRKAMRGAKERLEKGKDAGDVEFRSYVQDAFMERLSAEDLARLPTGKRRREARNRVAASLRDARIFAGPDWNGLTAEQKADLEKKLGPERWARLRDFDRLVERLSRASSVKRLAR